MTDRVKRRIISGGLLIAVLLMVVWPLMPLDSAGARLAALPESGPGFSARTMPLGDADKQLLGDAEAVCKMIAMNDGTRLVFTVIDGTRNRHAVHDPTYCFAGAGWTTEAKSAVPMPSGEACALSVRKDGQTAEALCFYDDGVRQYTSPLAYWARTSWRRITLGKGGREPVLVVCRTLPGERVDWQKVRRTVLPAMGFH
ncbi:hypothetical protein [Luteolibacter sp. LG18]|uniref:hypothetical protein n=1 Tax=Luteolibacter sp. LG18 TaxID=2819286 RepID=UPI002B29AF64|nr:hypothetical protein llg_42800 [Luteolibacter sp. LG18]